MAPQRHGGAALAIDGAAIVARGDVCRRGTTATNPP
jgi:hypothetical protein